MEIDDTKEYYQTLEKTAADEEDLAELKNISDFLCGNEDLKKVGKNAKLRYKRAKLIIPLLGENDSFDLIATPHNVIRQELERLYNMVDFFRKYPQASTTEHTKNFFVWWDHVASFLSCYFQAEQDVIFKYVQASSYIPKELDLARRRKVVEAMHDLMTTFNNSMKLIGARPPAEPIQKIGRKLELISDLLSYFRDIERLLSPYFNDIDERDLAKLYRDYGRRLISSGLWKHYHLLLISNALEADYAKIWVAKSISKITAWNSKTYKSQFEVSHVRTVNMMIDLMREREGESAVRIAKKGKSRARQNAENQNDNLQSPGDSSTNLHGDLSGDLSADLGNLITVTSMN